MSGVSAKVSWQQKFDKTVSEIHIYYYFLTEDAEGTFKLCQDFYVMFDPDKTQFDIFKLAT